MLLVASPTLAWSLRTAWAAISSSCAWLSVAGGVAVEDLGVALLEGFDGGFAGLPGGGGAEEDAVPILVEEAFAVVVPDGVELAG